MIRWWQKVSTKYPWRVMLVAFFVLISLGWYGSGLFSNLHSGESTDMIVDTPARLTNKAIDEKFGVDKSGQIVLFERRDDNLGSADSATYQAEVERLLKPLRDNKDIQSVTAYADQPQESFLSKDKTSTYAVVKDDRSLSQVYATLKDFAEQVDQSKLAVSIGGEAAAERQTETTAVSQLTRIEIISLPILLVLMVLFFRSVVAALIPLTIAGITIVGAFAITRVVSHFFVIDSYAVNVITILGIGLSIDYALLSVNRFREELKKGSVSRATRTIISTSGRTIFFSGITVIACLLSLLVFPFESLRSIGVGGAAAVAMAVIFTVIVLPALLMLVGKHIDRWHLPLPPSAKQSRTWKSVAHLTTSRPILTFVSGVAIIAIALLPLSQLKPGTINSAWLARGQSAQHVAKYLDANYDLPSPSIAVLVKTSSTANDRQLDVACDYTAKLRQIDGVKQVISATPTSKELSCDTIKQLVTYQQLPPQLAELNKSYLHDQHLRFDLIIDGEVGSGQARDVLAEVRDTKPISGEASIGGSEALLEETNQLYYDAIPKAVLAISINMFILMTLLLRSIVIPIQAIVINSIALAISMAVITGLFQLGWFKDLTGWSSSPNGIALAAPILFIAIAFGLAMDYSVFLYSRMREVYDKTGDPLKAVRQGLIKTGPIITAAAIVLFVVVAGFAFSSVMFMQIIGVGLALAVLVDAFFVRTLLVPSLMALMGKTSWYGPKWLSRWHIKHD